MTTNTNFLDKVVGFFSPVRGMRRAAARFAMDQMLAYEGARRGRSLGDWLTPNTSANAEIGPQIALLRSRSRDLCRNTPLARKILDERVIRAIGTGITPRSQAENPRDREEMDKVFQDWSEAVGYWAMQLIGARAIYESGESLLRHRYLSPAVAKSRGLPVPYWPVLLESDFIDTNKSMSIEPGTRIVNGVQYDSDDLVMGYWLFDTHPGDSLASYRGIGNGYSKFVPASLIEHGFRPERPGQGRGVPLFAPVITKIRQLGDLDEAIIIRKKVEACFAAFITSGPDGTNIGPTKTEDGQLVEEFSPGMVRYLRSGQGIQFADPAASGTDVSYIKMQRQDVCAGTFVPYELGTGDMSQTNYSSYRGGAVGFMDQLSVDQWQVFIPFFCAPVWRRLVEAAYVAGRISTPDASVKWGPPPFNLLDRMNEAEADQLELQIGKTTWPQMVAQQGNDPRVQMAEISESQKAFREQGIELPELYGGKNGNATEPDATKTPTRRAN